MQQFIQKPKQKIIVRRTPSSEVLAEVEKGNKFIIVEDYIDIVPERYMLIDMKYKGTSFKTLVPQKLMYFLANPGEGSIDDALDDIADFYNEAKDYEDDLIDNGCTNVQEAHWATTAESSYSTYLVNKLTKDGETLDKDVAKSLGFLVNKPTKDGETLDKDVAENFGLKDDYIVQRLKGIAALCLGKSAEQMKKARLDQILEHIGIQFGVKEKVTRKELQKVKCWVGSHQEIREEYRTVEREEIVTKTKEYAVLNKKVSQLEQEIMDHRVKNNSKIGRHDKALIRQYINLAYILKENPNAQLKIEPPENPNYKEPEDSSQLTWYMHGDNVRQEVKRQYVELGSQMGVVGGGRAKDFIADRMVDMYKIAADRLDSSPEVLRRIYVDNDTAPKPLRDVVCQYVDGKLTKEQATEKLIELKSKTEQYVRDLGANPNDAQRPTAVYHEIQDLEGKLRSDIVADSMRDDGSIDQKQLFLNVAEISLYGKWAELAKSLGERQPTADELITAQVKTYRAVYEANPAMGGFKDKKDFESWLGKFEQAMRNKGGSYLQAALPAFNAVVEKIGKE